MNINPIKTHVLSTINTVSTAVTSRALKNPQKALVDSFTTIDNPKVLKDSKSVVVNSLKTKFTHLFQALISPKPSKTTELTPFIRVEGNSYKIKSLLGKSISNQNWYVSETKDAESRIITICKEGETSLSGYLKNKTIFFDSKVPEKVSFSNIYLNNAKMKNVRTGITYNLPTIRINKSEKCSFADIINLAQQNMSKNIKG